MKGLKYVYGLVDEKAVGIALVDGLRENTSYKRFLRTMM
jgi:hypothetical protein